MAKKQNIWHHGVREGRKVSQQKKNVSIHIREYGVSRKVVRTFKGSAVSLDIYHL